MTYPIIYHIIWAEMRELKIKEHINNMLSNKAFQSWLKKSRKGEKISYYRGYLADPSIQRISPTSDMLRVRKFQKEVLMAYYKELINLVQKRHGDLDYEYTAIKR